MPPLTGLGVLCWFRFLQRCRAYGTPVTPGKVCRGHLLVSATRFPLFNCAPVTSDHLCLRSWRDVRVSSKEILPVIFVFDACESCKVHPVNGGCASPRLVGLKVRVDPFICARTQQPQGFVCPFCQTLAGRRSVPGVGEPDIQPARLSQWKSRRGRRH